MLVHDGSDSEAAARIAGAFAMRQIGVVSFEFPRSEGDLIAASSAMSHSRREPALLVSLGTAGLAVAAATRTIPGVRAIAAIAAPDGIVSLLLQLDPAILARRADGDEAASTIAAWAARHLASIDGPRSETPTSLAGRLTPFVRAI